MAEQLFIAEDGFSRCFWCSASEQYQNYHDNEWGFPVKHDIRLFEKISLEAFQSGLSWRTILAKRENFRVAFKSFDFHQIAAYGDAEIQELLSNQGIVRHRGKIEAVINNAQRAIEMQEKEGSLAKFFWQFEPEPMPVAMAQTQSQSALSQAISKELKKRGWKFVGPTTIYSFMQAMGMINDHADGCIIREKVENARTEFIRP